MVLFDDLRDVLFVVHAPSSLEQLAYAFLSFLGLPFIPPDFATSSPFSTDAFIHSELAERESARRTFWPKRETAPVFEVVGGEPMQPERMSGADGPWEAPFGTAPACVDLLFAARPRWFVALDKAALEGVDVDFARCAVCRYFWVWTHAYSRIIGTSSRRYARSSTTASSRSTTSHSKQP